MDRSREKCPWDVTPRATPLYITPTNVLRVRMRALSEWMERVEQRKRGHSLPRRRSIAPRWFGPPVRGENIGKCGDAIGEQ